MMAVWKEKRLIFVEKTGRVKSPAVMDSQTLFIKTTMYLTSNSLIVLAKNDQASSNNSFKLQNRSTVHLRIKIRYPPNLHIPMTRPTLVKHQALSASFVKAFGRVAEVLADGPVKHRR